LGTRGKGYSWDGPGDNLSAGPGITRHQHHFRPRGFLFVRASGLGKKRALGIRGTRPSLCRKPSARRLRGWVRCATGRRLPRARFFSGMNVEKIEEKPCNGKSAGLQSDLVQPGQGLSLPG
jgi:hypothetical protein